MGGEFVVTATASVEQKHLLWCVEAEASLKWMCVQRWRKMSLGRLFVDSGDSWLPQFLSLYHGCCGEKRTEPTLTQVQDVNVLRKRSVLRKRTWGPDESRFVMWLNVCARVKHWSMMMSPVQTFCCDFVWSCQKCDSSIICLLLRYNIIICRLIIIIHETFSRVVTNIRTSFWNI